MKKMTNFHEPSMMKLRNELSAAKYVTKEQRELLKDHLVMFPDLDRTFLFVYLRHLKPKKMVEIGSGEPTHVARAAFLANAKEGSPCKHVAIEPYRVGSVPNQVEVVKTEMQELPDTSLFEDLGDGDVHAVHRLFARHHALRRQHDGVHLPLAEAQERRDRAFPRYFLQLGYEESYLPRTVAAAADDVGSW